MVKSFEVHVALYTRFLSIFFYQSYLPHDWHNLAMQTVLKLLDAFEISWPQSYTIIPIGGPTYLLL